jgi:hypothetical protein
MEDTRFLVAAMAAKCREAIRGSNEEESSLPKALHPKHLLWMCDQIQKHAQRSPVIRLHRWIGFVQAGILANRMLDLDQIKAMFDEVKKSHSVGSEDQDLIDHLDVYSSFKLDLGDQG